MSMFIKHCKRQIIYNTSYQARKTAGMLIMQLRASVVLEQVEVHPSLLHLFRRDGSAFSRTRAPSSIRLSALHLRSSRLWLRPMKADAFLAPPHGDGSVFGLSSAYRLHLMKHFTLEKFTADFFILSCFLPFILVDVAVGTDPSLPPHSNWLPGSHHCHFLITQNPLWARLVQGC